ncbi:hypothetical protein [Viridibacillus arvi]|uniref:hypothetical protein n=1 Tax=Viridibacillus arvi TaxID=263475 RepID=UPI00187B7BD3|nr:hypothetical protein [Viridibacillus sp. JNUCC-6]QOV11182.1 hypothetical protein JNUCC6_21950 [Viridibacillus sp. JNUCC-6]
MTLREFIKFQEGIAIGEEYSFTYLNEEYWISHNPGACYLTRVRGSFTKEFETSEALFKNGTIEGKLLSEIYMNIQW